MQKIIIATTNEGKMKEFRALLAHKDVEIMSMKEAGIDIDIEENGTTFEENAAIKAGTVRDHTGCLCLSDDSGLLCDAYHTTELGDTDCTRISIMDSTRFSDWLKEREKALKTISDF